MPVGRSPPFLSRKALRLFKSNVSKGRAPRGRQRPPPQSQGRGMKRLWLPWGSAGNVPCPKREHESTERYLSSKSDKLSPKKVSFLKKRLLPHELAAHLAVFVVVAWLGLARASFTREQCNLRPKQRFDTHHTSRINQAPPPDPQIKPERWVFLGSGSRGL